MQSPLNVAIAGLGYWGPNLVRNFAASTKWRVALIADVNERRLAPMARLYPNTRTTTRFADVLEDPSVHLVAIATPPALHHEMALQAIAAGKHVLIEKPMTERSDHAREI